MEAERSRMAVSGALRSPLCVGGTAHVFDLVERLLDVGNEVRTGRDTLAPQRVSGIDGNYRLRAHVLAPEQELQQPHAVRRAIAPRARMARALRERADRLLPVEA